MEMPSEEKQKFEKQLVEEIRKGDKQAFEKLFFKYYYDLCSFAYQFLNCGQQAKDVVQDVFMQLWKRRKKWDISYSVKAYLLKSVRNRALNHIESSKQQEVVRDGFAEYREVSTITLSERNEKENALINQIWEIVDDMPVRRRSVFVLHRQHGLSYNEIAEVLEIQRKTVENHMGLALKEIRAQIGI